MHFLSRLHHEMAPRMGTESRMYIPRTGEEGRSHQYPLSSSRVNWVHVLSMTFSSRWDAEALHVFSTTPLHLIILMCYRPWAPLRVYFLGRSTDWPQPMPALCGRTFMASHVPDVVFFPREMAAPFSAHHLLLALPFLGCPILCTDCAKPSFPISQDDRCHLHILSPGT